MKGVTTMLEKIFDKNSVKWTDDAQFNLMLINSVLNYANNLLARRGWISLNDVYTLLGFPLEIEAQIIGWKSGTIGEFVDFECIEDGTDQVKIIFKNTVKLI